MFGTFVPPRLRPKCKPPFLNIHILIIKPVFHPCFLSLSLITQAQPRINCVVLENCAVPEIHTLSSSSVIKWVIAREMFIVIHMLQHCHKGDVF